MNCKDLEPRLSLYLYAELTAEERASVDAHLAACESCRAQLEETQRLHQLLSECPQPEPTAEMLAQCRQALDAALDREQLGWRGLLRSWFPGFTPFPALRAATVLTLLLFGFGLGWTLRPRATKLEQAAGGAVPTSFAGADLANMRISSISQVAPDPQTGAVRITLDAERRVTLEGSLDDPRIRQVLVDTVKRYDNAGIRRDTLDALRTQSHNPSVREALLYALRHDSNAGVRLEALRTVRGMEWGSDVYQSLLDVLERDSNVGVRVAAVDALVEHAETLGEEEALMEVVNRLATSDQNPYVRLKCLAAVQKLEGNED